MNRLTQKTKGKWAMPNQLVHRCFISNVNSQHCKRDSLAMESFPIHQETQFSQGNCCINMKTLQRNTVLYMCTSFHASMAATCMSGIFITYWKKFKWTQQYKGDLRCLTCLRF